jgi:hypothetical protein
MISETTPRLGDSDIILLMKIAAKYAPTGENSPKQSDSRNNLLRKIAASVNALP